MWQQQSGLYIAEDIGNVCIMASNVNNPWDSTTWPLMSRHICWRGPYNIVQFWIRSKELTLIFLRVVDCYCVCGRNSITTCTVYTFGAVYTHKKSFHGTMYFISSSNFNSNFLCFASIMSTDKLKKREIETKPNQAYATVTLPSPSKPETQVHTEPCPAYEVVVHTHH